MQINNSFVSNESVNFLHSYVQCYSLLQMLKCVIITLIFPGKHREIEKTV